MSAALPIIVTSFPVRPATTIWLPPVASIPSTAAPATTRWSPQQDTSPIVTSSAPVPGSNSVTGFEGANGDVADLRGFGLASFAALQPYISQAGADTVITLNGADILTLKSIVAGTLAADDFVFV